MEKYKYVNYLSASMAAGYLYILVSGKSLFKCKKL